MSYPILYRSTETAFNSNGVGILSDAMSCTVTEERNGSFELEMQYPVTGVHFGDIVLRSLILAKPNPVDRAQPFRVYSITRPLNGIVTVYAQHISYDLSGIPAMPFTTGSAAAAMVTLQSNAAVQSPFEFWTDRSAVAELTVKVPTSTRAVLGGTQGSVLDVYGGELKFDRFRVSLYDRRGADRGVSIRYGKNLTDLKQEENCLDVYTGLLPYWTDSDGRLVQLPEKVVDAPGTYDYTRILPMDFSGEWQDAPTEAQLRARAEEYIKGNSIGVPKVSLDVSFVQLEQTEEYKTLALFERVELCDTVTVEFPAMSVSATAKVNKTVYDVILDRYQSVSIGDARSTLADTIVQQSENTRQEISDTRSFLQKAVDNATKWLTSGNGVFVFIRDENGNLTDIACMDVPDVETAVNVWRWNHGGFGFSSHGYNGPFTTAITQDGHIVADFIDVGTLKASLIKSGVIQSLDGTTRYDLDAGTIQMGTDTAPHIYMDKEMIRWYTYMANGKDVGPTGIFYSVYGNTWIGATSRHVYMGWISEGKPVVGNDTHWYGVHIDNSDHSAKWNVGDLFAPKIDCGGDLGVGGMLSTNGLDAWGSKKRVIPTAYGVLGMEAMESPAPAFCDFGGGVCDADGVCCIALDERYLAVTEPKQRRRWVLTDTDGLGPLWVEDGPAGALVHGAPGQRFDWLCLAAQKGTGGEYAEVKDTKPPWLEPQIPDLLTETQSQTEFEENEIQTKLMEVLSA